LFEALGYKPHAGQLLVHRSNAPRRVLACGVRWGKTTCAVMEAVAALMQPREECLGWTVAPTLDLARLVFERTAVLLQKKFRHRIKSYSQREQRIVVVNFGGGLSVLEGKTADHPTSLLGESLDFLIVDEMVRIREKVWTEHLSQRLIDRRGWALFLSTPRGRDHFWRLFRRGQKGRDAAFESWSSPSWANPVLDRALIEEERGRLSKESFASQYAGEFTGEEVEPCDVCGGPSPIVSGVVALNEGDELGECTECQRPVDAGGRTVVHRRADGRPSLMVISLQNRKDGTRPKVEVPKVTADESQVVVRMREDERLEFELG
jgi:hypothetical protein